MEYHTQMHVVLQGFADAHMALFTLKFSHG